MHVAGFLREFAADIVGIALDMFAQRGERLGGDIGGLVGGGAQRIRLAPGLLHARRHQGLFDLVAAANGTGDMARLLQLVKGLGRLKPAVKPVILLTFQREFYHRTPKYYT